MRQVLIELQRAFADARDEAAREEAAARLGASMQGVAWALEEGLFGDPDGEDALRRHLAFAPALTGTDAGCGALADGLLLRGQGHGRAWIRVVPESALRDAAIYGFAVHGAGLDGAGLGDLADGLAATLPEGSLRAGLEAFAADARFAGASDDVPSDPGRAVQDAVRRLGLAARRSPELDGFARATAAGAELAGGVSVARTDARAWRLEGTWGRARRVAAALGVDPGSLLGPRGSGRLRP